jgi:lipoprotein-anchoring transpeptidase ErfK/SrfK
MVGKRKFVVVALLLLAIFTLAVPIVSADTTYTVKPGENLFRIALKFDLTTAELAAYNGIVNPDHIYAGQVLLIPDGSASQEQTTANTPEDDGAISEAEAAPVATEQVTHLVRRGEILSQIALDYGVSMQAIAQTNNIANTSLIFFGQSLIIPGSSPGSAATGVAAAPVPTVTYGDRWIDVDLTNQRLVAYEGSTPVYYAFISSGLYPYLTVTGQFEVYQRYQYQDMNGYRLGYDYYLPNVPYVQYFYKDYALHGTYWHNNFGTPMSHGCVNLATPDAQWLYNWSTYGTVVNVHY